MCNKPEKIPTAMETLGKGPVSLTTATIPEGAARHNATADKRTIEASRNRPAKRRRTSDSPGCSKVEPSQVASEAFGEADVLCGRGGGTNLHPGNRQYRDLILSETRNYDLANKTKKPGVARSIVAMIRESGGRFLRKGKDGLYYEIGDDAAREKTSQALRHRTFEMRNKEDPGRAKERVSEECVPFILCVNVLTVLFIFELQQKGISKVKGHLPLATSETAGIAGAPGASLSGGPSDFSTSGMEEDFSQINYLHSQLLQSAVSRQRLFEAGVSNMYLNAKLKALLALQQESGMKGVQQAQQLSLPSLFQRAQPPSFAGKVFGPSTHNSAFHTSQLPAQHNQPIFLRPMDRSDRVSPRENSLRNILTNSPTTILQMAASSLSSV